MSYQVFARKYRPQVFDEVVGQRLITDTLKNAILQNRVAHGYIFSGGRGVGKTTTARILAKGVNCLHGPTVTPCGECPSCQEIAAGNSVDVLEIDAASNRGIDEIRQLRETVRYLPARDRYKIFIIDEVHMLTSEAFNALLKTLEEPPPQSLFIMATTEPHKLPATIQSRCQHFAFRLLDYGEIVSQLEHICAAEKIKADEGALSALAQAGEGSLRDALSLLDQVTASCGDQLGEDRVRQLLGVVPAKFLQELMEAVHAADSARVLDRVSQLTAEGYELGHFCGEFTRFVRNMMVARSCGAASPLLQVSNDERKALAELSKLFSEEDLTRFFQILLRAEGELKYSREPKFHLELAMMKLVHARRLASLEDFIAGMGSPSSAEKPANLSQPGMSPAAAPAPPIKLAQAAPRSDFAPLAPSNISPTSVGHPATETPRSPASPAGRAAAPAPVLASGVEEDSRLSAIKALAYNTQKFLGSCLDPAVGWRFENGEVRFVFARKDSGLTEMLSGREQQEMLRSVCAQVLGQPVKIYVTLQDQEEGVIPARPSARDRASQDAGVEAFRKKFDCTMVDAKDLSQE
ncbi:MAG TPA: DNA polymerase III subunit gamma/tau [Terriglobia bacterium]|nr:DNA polymerase III subunit gamma/tau [Terriglobia bacterium]